MCRVCECVCVVGVAKEQSDCSFVSVWPVGPLLRTQTSNILAIADSGNMSDLEEQQRLMASYAPLEEGDRPEKISDVVPDVPKMPGVKLPDDVRIGKYMDLAVTQASGVNPQCGACLNAAKPVLILPTRLIMCCVPYYQWAYHYAYLVFLALPTNVIQALFGIALCFFGGTYVASIAAIEAFRQMGFAKVMQDIAIVRAEYEAIAAANAAADAAGDAHDGIDPTQRKLMLSMNAISEPQRLQSAIGSLWASYIAVLATLKLEFARTTAFALGIVEIIKFPAVRLLSPLLLGDARGAAVRPPQGRRQGVVDFHRRVDPDGAGGHLRVVPADDHLRLLLGPARRPHVLRRLHQHPPRERPDALPAVHRAAVQPRRVRRRRGNWLLARRVRLRLPDPVGLQAPLPAQHHLLPVDDHRVFLRMQISMSASSPALKTTTDACLTLSVLCFLVLCAECVVCQLACRSLSFLVGASLFAPPRRLCPSQMKRKRSLFLGRATSISPSPDRPAMSGGARGGDPREASSCSSAGRGHPAWQGTSRSATQTEVANWMSGSWQSALRFANWNSGQMRHGMHTSTRAVTASSASIGSRLGKMNEPRRKLCIKCFSLGQCGDGSGFLTIEDIAPYYNAADHPDVKEEKKTEEEVLKEFLDGFEGGNGDRNGSVTIDEWISYYEDISTSIDEDDLFGTMLASTWSSLTTKNPEGETVPAIQYVSESDMNVLESILRKNIYQKSSGVSEDKTLKKAFKQFDTDGSGEVSFREFLLAMERFGLSVTKPGDRGGGGVPPEVMRGLFDRYNADQSEAISYSEFSAGLYGVASKDDSEDEADAYNPQGGQNPWLPTLVGKESMDDHYRRPYRQVQEKDPLGNVFNVERRVKGQRSIAARAQPV